MGTVQVAFEVVVRGGATGRGPDRKSRDPMGERMRNRVSRPVDRKLGFSTLVGPFDRKLGFPTLVGPFHRNLGYPALFSRLFFGFLYFFSEVCSVHARFSPVLFSLTFFPHSIFSPYFCPVLFFPYFFFRTFFPVLFLFIHWFFLKYGTPPPPLPPSPSPPPRPFPYDFTIQLAFLPYCLYLSTIQLVFLPYFPNNWSFHRKWRHFPAVFFLSSTKCWLGCSLRRTRSIIVFF